MKKIILTILLAGCMMICLSACGAFEVNNETAVSGSEENASKVSEAEVAAEEQTTEAEEQVVETEEQVEETVDFGPYGVYSNDVDWRGKYLKEYAHTAGYGLSMKIGDLDTDGIPELMVYDYPLKPGGIGIFLEVYRDGITYILGTDMGTIYTSGDNYIAIDYSGYSVYRLTEDGFKCVESGDEYNGDLGEEINFGEMMSHAEFLFYLGEKENELPIGENGCKLQLPNSGWYTSLSSDGSWESGGNDGVEGSASGRFTDIRKIDDYTYAMMDKDTEYYDESSLLYLFLPGKSNDEIATMISERETDIIGNVEEYFTPGGHLDRALLWIPSMAWSELSMAYDN